MYSFKFPKGKNIAEGESTEGFVDTPTKLGIIRGMSPAEVKKICDEGLKPKIVPAPKKKAAPKKKK